MSTKSSTRRSFLRSVGIGAASLALPQLAAGRARLSRRKKESPNLLIIHTDQLSCWALSIYAKKRTDTANYGNRKNALHRFSCTRRCNFL